MGVNGDLVAGMTSRLTIDGKKVSSDQARVIILGILADMNDPNFAQAYAEKWRGAKTKTDINDGMIDYWDVLSFIHSTV